MIPIPLREVKQFSTILHPLTISVCFSVFLCPVFCFQYLYSLLISCFVLLCSFISSSGSFTSWNYSRYCYVLWLIFTWFNWKCLSGTLSTCSSPEHVVLLRSYSRSEWNTNWNLNYFLGRQPPRSHWSWFTPIEKPIFNSLIFKLNLHCYFSSWTVEQHPYSSVFYTLHMKHLC